MDSVKHLEDMNGEFVTPRQLYEWLLVAHDHNDDMGWWDKPIYMDQIVIEGERVLVPGLVPVLDMGMEKDVSGSYMVIHCG